VCAETSAKSIPFPVSSRNMHKKYFLYLGLKKFGISIYVTKKNGQEIYMSLKIELPT
jgi:hypothetical protein